MKKLCYLIILLLLLQGCSDGRKYIDEMSYSEIRAMVDAMTWDSYIRSPTQAYAVLLGEKYNVPDSICQIILLSYIGAMESFIVYHSDKFDSSLIQREKHSILMEEEFTPKDMRNYINNLHLRFGIDKSTISCILLDFIVLYKLNKIRESIDKPYED